jgi:hypothetical protein
MKQTMLFLFGIGDTFFHRRSLDMSSKLEALLTDPKKEYFGVTRFNKSADIHRDCPIDKILSLPTVASRVIDVKLCSNDPFSVNNQISVPDTANDDVKLLDGDQLDHLIPPGKFDIHIAGIDINGIFIPLVKQLKAMGYSVTVYSDIIKPFNKGTIESIQKSKVRFRRS